MTYSSIIGILRETKHMWERRAPLTPSHVADLLKSANIKTIIQPCTRRAFPLQSYISAGATAREDLSEADLILGIKEVEVKSMIANKRYLYFSHTHKGQSYNMPMLNDILNKKKITLLDHELLTDENTSSRLVKFGTFAGYAGFVDGLHALGRRLLAQGYSTPFLNIAMSHSYPSLDHARRALVEAGEFIAKHGLPQVLCPFTIVFTGNGSVSTGAQAMLKCLPHEFIDPSNLGNLCENPKAAHKNLVYASIVTQKDYLYLKKDPNLQFNKKTFFDSPEKFGSFFHKRIAPYTSFLVTGHYWNHRSPRLLTFKNVNELYSQWKSKHRMISIADISCDINGGLEFMSRATKIDDPYFFYDPISKTEHRDLEVDGIQIMSVDILPSEFPVESSKEFGDKLLPIIKEGSVNNWDTSVLRRATIAHDGKLIQPHEWLHDHMKSQIHGIVLEKKHVHKVAIFGSGYVSGPAIDYLLRFPDVEVILASQNETEAKNLLNKRPNASRVSVRLLDISNAKDEEIDKLMHEVNAAISLVPATLHPMVAKSCIRTKKPLVTASYVSDEMAALHQAATEANVLLLNEMGLDPGIDHMSSKQFIDNIHASGGTITGFRSSCGGLPAPECSENPLGYKFSWSPRGALLAALNGARYIENGNEIDVSGVELMNSAKPLNILRGLSTCELPNRDSTKYIERYGLSRRHLTSMKRGTLRYSGYCENVDAFRRLGLLNTTPSKRNPELQSWPVFLWNEMKGDSAKNEESPPTRDKLMQRIIQAGVSETVANGMEWLGMFDAATPIPRVLRDAASLDVLCELLTKKLVYAAGERDLVLMHHEFDYITGHGQKMIAKATLAVYGDPLPTGTSAMARTVGLPAAAAAKLILDGKVGLVGVVGPMHREIYEPVLSILTKEGIVFKHEELLKH